MNKIPCPAFSAMLKNGQQVTHRRHTRGWLESPDGRFFQPKACDVQFIKGARLPFMACRREHWLLRVIKFFS